jgi:biotin operon repressor
MAKDVSRNHNSYSHDEEKVLDYFANTLASRVKSREDYIKWRADLERAMPDRSWNAIRKIIRTRYKALRFGNPKVALRRANENQNKDAKVQLSAPEKVLKIILRKRLTSISELSHLVDIDRQLVFKTIRDLSERDGYDIRVNAKTGQVSLVTETGETAPPIDVEVGEILKGKEIFRDHLTIGVIAGLNLGSKQQDMPLLYTVYRTIVPQEGIDIMVINGGLVQGNLTPAKANETFLRHGGYYLLNGEKGEEAETVEGEELERPDDLTEKLPLNGEKGEEAETVEGEELERPKDLTEKLFRSQVEYVARNFPLTIGNRKVKTYVLSGLNEDTFRKHGLNVVKAICERRRSLAGGPSDLFYREGHIANFCMRNAGEPVNVLVFNSKKKPFRGAYTRSHRPQKTAVAVASWFRETLRNQGLQNYPKVVCWTDGRGVYTHKGDAAGMQFVSLAKLSGEDPTDLELDTSPNVGITIIRLEFDPEGKLKPNGIKVCFRDLAPYLSKEDEGWAANLATGKKLATLERQTLDSIKASPRSIGELCRELHRREATIEASISKLREKGAPIVWNEVANNYYYERIPAEKFSTIPAEELYGDLVWIKAMLFSETHYGGLQAQPKVMPVIRDLGAEYNADFNSHSGDVTNGGKHADYVWRLQNILNRPDDQIALAVAAMGALDRPTFIRDGDHDTWGTTDVVAAIVKALNDRRREQGLEPIFHHVTEDTDFQFEVKGFVWELEHLKKGKSRGFSYSPQLIFEDKLGEFVKHSLGEAGGYRQPNVHQYGQWHIEIIFYQGGTIHVLVPGLQAPTGWERSMGLVHQFGAWVLEVARNKRGNVFAFDARYINLSAHMRKRTVKELSEKLIELALTV